VDAYDPDAAIAAAAAATAEEERRRSEAGPGARSPSPVAEAGHCHPYGKEAQVWRPCEELDELEGLNFYLNFARTRGVRGVGATLWPHSDVEVGIAAAVMAAAVMAVMAVMAAAVMAAAVMAAMPGNRLRGACMWNWLLPDTVYSGWKICVDPPPSDNVARPLSLLS